MKKSIKKILKYGEATKFELWKGDILEIFVTSDNPQLSDLWMRKLYEPSITYHPGLTIDNTYKNKKRKFFAETGTILYSNEEEPMMEVVNDGGFKHDLVMPGCRKSVYERHGLEDKKGCRDLIAEVMNIPPSQIMGTFNLFYEMRYTTSGRFKTTQTRSYKGSYCKFRALDGLEVAVTACPADLNVMKQGKGAIEVRIKDFGEAFVEAYKKKFLKIKKKT